MSQQREDGCVDVRSREEFDAGHEEGATWIPLERLGQLLCALPPRDSAATVWLAVVAATQTAGAAAAALIASAKYQVSRVTVVSDATALVSRAPSRRLWQPNAFLSQFVARIEAGLAQRALPRTCLDEGCGSGRDAVFLAARGWRVFALDTNARLLAVARDLAAHELPPCSTTASCGDIVLEEADVTAPSLPPAAAAEAPFALVHVARFLHRPALADGSLQRLVRVGGFVVYHTFTEPSVKPRGTKHVLQPGELRRLFLSTPPPQSWAILEHGEASLGDGRRVQYTLTQREN